MMGGGAYKAVAELFGTIPLDHHGALGGSREAGGFGAETGIEPAAKPTTKEYGMHGDFIGLAPNCVGNPTRHPCRYLRRYPRFDFVWLDIDNRRLGFEVGVHRHGSAVG